VSTHSLIFFLLFLIILARGRKRIVIGIMARSISFALSLPVITAIIGTFHYFILLLND
jgi:hypothetical protein